MRVLVIEDETDLLASLATALREEGYAVDTAADGEDGLFKASSWDYDALVLDVMLPRLDGWAVLEHLRLTKKTPVLMLTARDAARDRVRGLDTGADDYVMKPFAMTGLSDRIRAIIPYQFIRADNIALGFGHLRAVLYYHALSKEVLKRFIKINNSYIVKEFCNEPGV